MQQMTISEKAAAANIAEQAWTERRRHIEAGGIIGTHVESFFRLGWHQEAYDALVAMRGSDFLDQPVYTVARPNRHRVAAAAKDRRFGRRRDRRRGERQWRAEWQFALVAA